MQSALSGLAATLSSGHGWIGDWSPGIGDPTFVGWLTVVAYFAAALACWSVLRDLRGARVTGKETAKVLRKERGFWLALTLALLFLCINKQLDLQTAFTECMRALAHQQGWYEARFGYQVAFIAGMAVCLPLGVWLCFRIAGDLPAPVKTAGVGLVVIACFVLIRAASFHHIDRLLGQTVLLLRLNWLLELGGIAVVLLGARWRARHLRRAR